MIKLGGVTVKRIIFIVAFLFVGLVAVAEAPMLELLSWKWNEGPTEKTASVTGEVKNISSKNLERVEVLVGLRDKNGVLIAHADSYLKIDPLPPGATSPFRVIFWNIDPEAAKTIDIRFLFRGGAEIPTKYTG